MILDGLHLKIRVDREGSGNLVEAVEFTVGVNCGIQGGSTAFSILSDLAVRLKQAAEKLS